MTTTYTPKTPWSETPLNDRQAILSSDNEHRLPELGATIRIPIDKKVVQVHFFTNDQDFWAVEFSAELGVFAGFIKTPLGLEWGPLTIQDLLGLRRPGQSIERDSHWIPRPIAV